MIQPKLLHIFANKKHTELIEISQFHGCATVLIPIIQSEQILSTRDTLLRGVEEDYIFKFIYSPELTTPNA